MPARRCAGPSCSWSRRRAQPFPALARVWLHVKQLSRLARKPDRGPAAAEGRGAAALKPYARRRLLCRLSLLDFAQSMHFDGTRAGTSADVTTRSPSTLDDVQPLRHDMIRLFLLHYSERVQLVAVVALWRSNARSACAGSLDCLDLHQSD